MTAKEELRQIKMLDERITNNTEELMRLRAMAEKVTSVVSGESVSRTRNTDTMTDAVAKIIALQDKLNADIDKYVNLKESTLQRLSRLENPTYYGILYRRYFLYKTWEQIACEMNYTYQWVCELHGRALQKYGKLQTLDRNHKENLL